MTLLWEAESAQCCQWGTFSLELPVTLLGVPEAGDWGSVIDQMGTRGPVPGDTPALGGKCLSGRGSSSKAASSRPLLRVWLWVGGHWGPHGWGEGRGYNRGAVKLGSPRPWHQISHFGSDHSWPEWEVPPRPCPRVIRAGAPGSDAGRVSQAGVGARAPRQSLMDPRPLSSSGVGPRPHSRACWETV